MQVPEFARGFSNLTTYEGEQVRFEVEVRGDPPPSLTWYRDGEIIRDSPDFQVRPISLVSSFPNLFSRFRSLPKAIVVYFISPKCSWKIKVYLPVRLPMRLAHRIVQHVLLLNHDLNFNLQTSIFIRFPLYIFSQFLLLLLFLLFISIHFCNAFVVSRQTVSMFSFLHAYSIGRRPLNNALLLEQKQQ